MSPAQWTTAVGNFTSHPAAFVIVVLYGMFWFWSEPITFDAATLIGTEPRLKLFLPGSDGPLTDAPARELNFGLRRAQLEGRFTSMSRHRECHPR